MGLQAYLTPCIESHVNVIDLTDDPAWPTWTLCKSVLKSHNYLLRFPKNTDPRKTYQWRYVTKLSERFEEWEFDRPTAKVFLEIAITKLGYANIRKNGLACLFRNGLLDIVHKELESREVDLQKIVDGIYNSNSFLIVDTNFLVSMVATTILSHGTQPTGSQPSISHYQDRVRQRLLLYRSLTQHKQAYFLQNQFYIPSVDKLYHN